MTITITITTTETTTIKRKCNRLKSWAHNYQTELDLLAVLLLGDAVTLGLIVVDIQVGSFLSTT